MNRMAVTNSEIYHMSLFVSLLIKPVLVHFPKCEPQAVGCACTCCGYLARVSFTVTVNDKCSFCQQSHSSVSLRLSCKFRGWHSRWASQHVSESQHKVCVDWLMGRGEGVVPNRTRVLTDNDVARPPYRSYNRYRVERLVVSGGSGNEP